MKLFHTCIFNPVWWTNKWSLMTTPSAQRKQKTVSWLQRRSGVLFPVYQGRVLIGQKLFVPKPAGDTWERLWGWYCSIAQFEGGKLPGLTGGRCSVCVGVLDKRPSCYLFVKGYTGLAGEAKATTICVFHTLLLSGTRRELCVVLGVSGEHALSLSDWLISTHTGSMMKDALSEEVGKPQDMFSSLWYEYHCFCKFMNKPLLIYHTFDLCFLRTFLIHLTNTMI